MIRDLTMDDREAMAWQTYLQLIAKDRRESFLLGTEPRAQLAEQAFRFTDSFLAELADQRTDGQR